MNRLRHQSQSHRKRLFCRLDLRLPLRSPDSRQLTTSPTANLSQLKLVFGVDLSLLNFDPLVDTDGGGLPDWWQNEPFESLGNGPAEDSGKPLQSADPSLRPLREERVAALQRISQLREKINEEPEIASLHEQMVAAQKTHQEAFEAALGKENPRLLNQYQAECAAMMKRTVRSLLTSKLSEPEQMRPSGYDRLSLEERTKLNEVRRQAIELPSVKEARNKRSQAQNEEEQSRRVKEDREAIRKAMLEGDRDVGALFKKWSLRSDRVHRITTLDCGVKGRLPD